jgi:hypothetical protein
MQNDEAKNKLEELRERVLGDISGMADQLASGENVDYDSLLTLARTTGRMEFLDKALERAEAIENPDEKMHSLLDLLDAVDVQLGLMNYDDDQADESNADADNSDQDQGQSQDAQQNNDNNQEQNY